MSKVVVLIMTLVHLICCENPELKLIRELNDFFSFDHNLFLLEASVDTNRFISSTGQAPQAIYVFNNVISGTIAELETVTEISSKNIFTLVALSDSSFERNLNFFGRLKNIQRLQKKMKIGIFFPQLSSMDDLSELFEWCKENLIVNIFAAIEGPTSEDALNIFTFHTFGPFDVLNVTNSDSYENYFPSLQSNFRQQALLAYYPFRDRTANIIWTIVLRMM